MCCSGMPSSMQPTPRVVTGSWRKDLAFVKLWNHNPALEMDIREYAKPFVLNYERSFKLRSGNTEFISEGKSLGSSPWLLHSVHVRTVGTTLRWISGLDDRPLYSTPRDRYLHLFPLIRATLHGDSCHTLIAHREPTFC